MRQIAIVILSIILSNHAFSQHKTFSKEHEVWLDGYAYLTSGEKIKGKINYHFVTETIQINTNGIIKTYPAIKVSRFSVYDSNQNKDDYYSFSLTHTENAKFEYGSYDPKLRKRNIYNNHHFLFSFHKNNKAAILTNLDFEHDQREYSQGYNGIAHKKFY